MRGRRLPCTCHTDTPGTRYISWQILMANPLGTCHSGHEYNPRFESDIHIKRVLYYRTKVRSYHPSIEREHAARTRIHMQIMLRGCWTRMYNPLLLLLIFETNQKTETVLCEKPVRSKDSSKLIVFASLSSGVILRSRVLQNVQVLDWSAILTRGAYSFVACPTYVVI